MNKIVQILIENPNSIYEEISDKLSIPRRTIAREIKALRENGYIKRIGSDKTGYWEVIGCCDDVHYANVIPSLILFS